MSESGASPRRTDAHGYWRANLRIMAGLDRPTKGKILIDGKDVTGVSVRKRSVAMVYQLFVNYPSLTVYQNIASPLKTGNDDITSSGIIIGNRNDFFLNPFRYNTHTCNLSIL